MADVHVIKPRRMRRSGAGVLPLVLLGFAACCAAFAAPDKALAMLLGAGGAGFLMVGLSAIDFRRKAPSVAEAQGLLARDDTPSFVTDQSGQLRAVNDAARGLMTGGEIRIGQALQAQLANAEHVTERLLMKLGNGASTVEDVNSERDTKRIRVIRAGRDELVWRVETWAARPGTRREDFADALPILSVGRQGKVLSMNTAAHDLLGRQPALLADIGLGPSFKPGQTYSIRTAAGQALCATSQMHAQAGRSEILLLPLDPGLPQSAPMQGGLEALPVPLLKLDTDGTVISSNELARELLGVPDVDGANVGALLEGLGRSLQDWLDDMLLGRASHASEFLKVRQPDISTFVQVIIKPAVEDGRNILVAVLNDATELKTLEAQFVQSQKMQAIGQLAGGVAHDFNNLLTAISGHCDLLMLRFDRRDQDYSDLEQIRQNANRAGALVGQLLAFSRKQTLRPEVLNVQDALSDLTHLLNRLLGEMVSLDFVDAGEDLQIRADKRQLEQVLMNLVVNARDAMPDGGVISIRSRKMVLTHPLQRDRAEVQPGAYVVIEVEDQGTGIPKDRLQKIFEPFFTTKRTGEGTGLGLSTVYGIVKQTGGFIFVDSDVGKGTTFSLIFPSYVDTGDRTVPHFEDAATPEPEQVQDAPAPRQATVLLVEDEAPVRAFASRALKLEGYDVLEAASGEEALEIFQGAAERIDMIVSDVIMPGLKGPEWVALACRNVPDMKVIFITGYAEDAFDGNGPVIEHAKFLQKPFSLKDLAETVRGLLNSE